MINFKNLQAALLFAFAIMCTPDANAQDIHTNQYGQVYQPGTYEIINTNAKTRGNDPTDLEFMEEIMACPENSVLGYSYQGYGNYNNTGAMCADEGREGASSHFYQMFEGNLCKINAVRFFGVFNYYTEENGPRWLFCNERGNPDENGNLTTPIRIRVTFNRPDVNGLPGKEIYSKEFDIIPKNTGLLIGNNKDGFGYIYQYDVELGEEVKLETGFLGVTAVDTGEKPSCWFSVFTTYTSYGKAYVGVNDNTKWWESFQPSCYCLLGTGELSAKKAVKLERFMTPLKSAKGKYEKVAVEISNAGSEPVSGIELELWKDDQLISREKIDDTINPINSDSYDGKYKYVFDQFVDCSAVGKNRIVVKNVYTEDEKLCEPELRKTIKVMEDGYVVESASQNDSYNYIRSVKAGTIYNESSHSNYTDYTDMKTDIMPGDEIEVTITTESESNCCMWVDWNNNGNFADNGDLIGSFSKEGVVTVKIPEGIDIKPGDKRMRIVSTYSAETPSYSGSYNYGETEDYTLTVLRKDGSSGIENDVDILELSNEDSKAVLNISSVGAETLTANAYINYILPGSPDGMAVSHSSEKAPEEMTNRLKTVALKYAAPELRKDQTTQFVLGYDRNPASCASMAGDEAVFGQLYPGKMLSYIKGMQISSVDVYVGDVPGKASIVIYEENKNSNLIGKVIAEKAFTPKADSWNHVQLDQAVTISGNNGIIAAIKISGLRNGEYYIGADNSRAVIGFGDLVGYGGTWWSMADLGVQSNYCIRANVTGAKTPAISWLDSDKKNFSIPAGSEDKMNISYNGTKLDTYLYSAVIEIVTNDELRKTVRIPVYMVNDIDAGILSADLGESEVTYANGEIKVTSEKKIFNISVYDIKGQLVENIDPQYGETVISTLNYDKGIYIISLMYADGNRQGIKIPVMK